MDNFHKKAIPKLRCIHPFLCLEFISNPDVQNPDLQSMTFHLHWHIQIILHVPEYLTS